MLPAIAPCQSTPDFSFRREAHAHSSVLFSGWGPLSLTSFRRLSSCYRQQEGSHHCKADCRGSWELQPARSSATAKQIADGMVC